MSEDTASEDSKIGIAILDIPLGWSEKVLASKRLANMLILACIIATAIVFFGIAVFATNLFAPASAAHIPYEQADAPNR